jgi:outer membrane protein assembly factor BamA
VPLDKTTAAPPYVAFRSGGLIGRLTVAGALSLAVLVPTALLAQQAEFKPLVVRDLSFAGNHAIADDTLRVAIATTQSAVQPIYLRWTGLGEKRYFDEIEFRRDVIRLTILYRQSGFPDAVVDTVVTRGAEEVSIKFVIFEGRPVRVMALTVTGAEGVLGARLLRDLPLRVGDPFSRFQMQASADTIRAMLRDRGHPFGQVLRNFDVDREQREATVHFEADPGPLARVGRIEVVGARAIDENVVRRMVAIRPGQPYSQQALYESQRDLYRMGVFNFVAVSLADTVPKGAADSLVTIRVQVTEGSLRRLRAGAGWGTIDCFRGLAGRTDRNFLGGARSLDLSARVSKIGTGTPFNWGLEHTACPTLGGEQDTDRLKLNYDLTASLRQPFVLGRRNTATFTLSATRRSEFQAFVREAVGGSVALTQQTTFQIPVTLSYELSYGKTVAAPAIFCSLLNQCGVADTLFSRRRLQATAGLGLVRDRSNSPLDPTDGSVITANVRYAGRITGSDSLSQFAKGVFEMSVYRELGRRSVFAWRVRIGTIISPQLGNVGEFVPPQERFYGGGPTSVRGYAQNELGPVVRVARDSIVNADSTRSPQDTITAPTGGNQQLFANVELRLPLPLAPDRLRLAIFVDAGQIFQRSDELISLRGLRVTPGVGIRLTTPLGPLRLDVAYNGYAPQPGPLYHQQGAQLVLVDPAFAPPIPEQFIKRLRFHLSVGQAF